MTIYNEFDPTSLMTGEGPYHHRPVTVKGGQGVLARGTVLGRQGASGVGQAAGTNTGNGTLTLDGSTPALANVQAGVYVVKFTSATAYNVFDPKGDELGQGINGAAFADQIKFVTAAGGTPFVAGDSFTVTISNPDKYVISKPAAIDGSQIPSAIVAADTDTTLGDVVAPAYFDGGFAIELLTYDNSWSATALRAAIRQNNIPLFLRTTGTLG